MKKHPTLKSLRQGQTIYSVISSAFGHSTVTKVFIHSDNVETPEDGTPYKEVPVRQVRAWIHVFGNNKLFYSRRRAETYIKNNY